MLGERGMRDCISWHSSDAQARICKAGYNRPGIRQSTVAETSNSSDFSRSFNGIHAKSFDGKDQPLTNLFQPICTLGVLWLHFSLRVQSDWTRRCWSLYNRPLLGLLTAWIESHWVSTLKGMCLFRFRKTQVCGKASWDMSLQNDMQITALPWRVVLWKW